MITEKKAVEYMKTYGQLCESRSVYKNNMANEVARTFYLESLRECWEIPEGLLKKLGTSKEKLRKEHLNNVPLWR
jgi:hypothetical protein